MTQFSQNDPSLNTLLDLQSNGLEIEAKVKEGMSYTQAACAWLEENSILPNQYSKYIPVVITDKIRDEVIQNNELRPSVIKSLQTSSLEDFL